MWDWKIRLTIKLSKALMFVLDLKRGCNRVVPFWLPKPTFLGRDSFFQTWGIVAFNGYIEIIRAFHVSVGST